MDNLFEFFLEDFRRSFSGWDFSYISATDRMSEFPLKWNYTSKILPELRNAHTFLDMGTGGGEFLSRLKPLPSRSYATEGYQPNFSIAKTRLEPLGVKVLKPKDMDSLDFRDDFFDLIINRHAKYSASEVQRTLKPSARFITQQVGGKNCIELNKLLGYDENSDIAEWDLNSAVSQLNKEGLKIIEEYEDFPKARFFDIGAVVYYLKAVPWQIQDFDIDDCRDSLKKLHNLIEKEGFIDVKEHRFFIAAEKVE